MRNKAVFDYSLCQRANMQMYIFKSLIHTKLCGKPKKRWKRACIVIITTNWMNWDKIQRCIINVQLCTYIIKSLWKNPINKRRQCLIFQKLLVIGCTDTDTQIPLYLYKIGSFIINNNIILLYLTCTKKFNFLKYRLMKESNNWKKVSFTKKNFKRERNRIIIIILSFAHYVVQS